MEAAVLFLPVIRQQSNPEESLLGNFNEKGCFGQKAVESAGRQRSVRVEWGGVLDCYQAIGDIGIETAQSSELL